MSVAAVFTLMLWMALIGLIAYLIVKLVPMPDPIRTLIYVVAGIACLLLLLGALGVPAGPIRLN